MQMRVSEHTDWGWPRRQRGLNSLWEHGLALSRETAPGGEENHSVQLLVWNLSV